MCCRWDWTSSDWTVEIWEKRSLTLKLLILLNEWMKWMKVQWLKVHSKTATRGRLSLTHLTVQPLSIVKSLNGPRVRVISPVGKEKVYGGKDLLKSQVLSSEWDTERVREDARCWLYLNEKSRKCRETRFFFVMSNWAPSSLGSVPDPGQALTNLARSRIISCAFDTWPTTRLRINISHTQPTDVVGADVRKCRTWSRSESDRVHYPSTLFHRVPACCVVRRCGDRHWSYDVTKAGIDVKLIREFTGLRMKSIIPMLSAILCKNHMCTVYRVLHKFSGWLPVVCGRPSVFTYLEGTA